VSRVGGSAQIKAMRQVAGSLRLDLANYRELEAFVKFGSDLDKTTQSQITRGQRLVELLKQDQYSPMPVAKQIAIIFVGTQGLLDKLPVKSVGRFEKEFLEYLDNKYPDIFETITREKMLSDELKEKLKNTVEEFLKIFTVEE